MLENLSESLDKIFNEYLAHIRVRQRGMEWIYWVKIKLSVSLTKFTMQDFSWSSGLNLNENAKTEALCQRRCGIRKNRGQMTWQV